MGCKISDFFIQDEWITEIILGHKVEMVIGSFNQIGPLVLYKIDGKFQGSTGDIDAVRYWVQRYHDKQQ